MNTQSGEKLNALQEEEIRLGLAHGIAAEVYSSPAYSWEHMLDIRHLMEDGIKPNRILNKDLSPTERKKAAFLDEIDSGELLMQPDEIQAYLNSIDSQN